MKVNANDNEIVVYLNKYYTEKIDFLDVESLEEYMNSLFVTLKKSYNLKINGYYNIDVYIDDNYGAVICMQKEEIDYYEYFTDQVETQVTIHNNANFLYKISDFFEIRDYLSNNKYSLYKYNNELYLKLNSVVDNINFGNILEYCTEICYDMNVIIKTNNLLYCNK